MATRIFEIYASDLTETAQQELCRKCGVKNISETNYDVFPITTVEFEVDGEDDEDEE